LPYYAICLYASRVLFLHFASSFVGISHYFVPTFNQLPSSLGNNEGGRRASDSLQVGTKAERPQFPSDILLPILHLSLSPFRTSFCLFSSPPSPYSPAICHQPPPLSVILAPICLSSISKQQRNTSIFHYCAQITCRDRDTSEGISNRGLRAAAYNCELEATIMPE